MGDVLILGYLGVAVVFACIQWVDNQRVYYVGGDPSGCMVGMLWPLWVPILIGFWTYRLFKLIARTLGDRHDD